MILGFFFDSLTLDPDPDSGASVAVAPTPALGIHVLDHAIGRPRV